MGEAMLDRNPLAETCAAPRSRDELAEPVLEGFVLGNPNGSAGTESGGRTGSSDRAPITQLCVELDGHADAEGVDLSVGAHDRPSAQVEVEIGLGEEPSVGGLPRAANDLPSSIQDL